MSAIRHDSVPAAGSVRSSRATLCLAWAPVVLWIGFIYSLSSDRFSDENTAAWLSGIVSSFGVSPAVIKAGNLIVRKCAHFVEYAVLGALTLRALRATRPDRRGRQLVVAAVALTVACAAVDELHQHLATAMRGGRAMDVVLDTVGALAGAAIGALYLDRRPRRGAT